MSYRPSLSLLMSVEVSCVEMSLAATFISRKNMAAKLNISFRWLTAKLRNKFPASIIRLRSPNSASRLIFIYGG